MFVLDTWQGLLQTLFLPYNFQNIHLSSKETKLSVIIFKMLNVKRSKNRRFNFFVKLYKYTSASLP